jgi:rhomboid protease GluP
MKNYAVKFRHIVPAFLVIAWGTTLITLLFRWLFTIRYELLPIKEDLFNIWIPLLLPWIPMTIWLRPKLRIVKFKKGDASMLLQIIAWMTMVVMMIASNSYIKTASGELTQLKTIDSLTATRSRYISIENIQLNKKSGSAHTEFSTSGKYNEHLDIDSYFVYPFQASTSDNEFRFWYGVKFEKQIGNRISPEEKEEKYQAFFKKAASDFESYPFSQPDYFEVLPLSDDREGFIKAIGELHLNSTVPPVIIEPREGLYSERNGNTLAWTFGSFGIGLAVFLFALTFPQYDESEHEKQRKHVKPESDDIIDMLKFLIPGETHYATSILIDLTILIFIIMVAAGVHIVSPNGAELLAWGANRRAETTGGEWWRLISSMFIHGGIMHLLLNIYGLVIAALFVEVIFGRVKYFILYFVSGICGSLASIYWYENTVSVGASGAIFGLYGALLGLLLTDAFPKEGRRTILLLIGPYVAINLLFGLTGGIDNAAHIGGLLSGAVAGIWLYLTKDKADVNREA